MEIGDYRNSVKHGMTLLNDYAGRLLPKTHFTALLYLGEANCMLGNYSEALKLLDQADKIMQRLAEGRRDPPKLSVEMLATKLVHGEHLEARTIV